MVLSGCKATDRPLSAGKGSYTQWSDIAVDALGAIFTFIFAHGIRPRAKKTVYTPTE